MNITFCSFILAPEFVSCQNDSLGSRHAKITGHEFDLLWSRDVIGHVPFDSRGSSSYPWSIVTMGTSGTVKDILRFKDNGVTTLTFCGHVTSSITWTFEKLICILNYLYLDYIVICNTGYNIRDHLLSTVSYMVLILLLTKNSGLFRNYPGPPWKIFQDLFAA